MKILIFEPVLSGHHLEYLHHYYVGAVSRPQNDYIFLIPRKFEQLKGLYNWYPADNIEIRYIEEKYEMTNGAKNIYINGWRVSKVLKKYVKAIKPDRIILTTIMQFIPFICWLLPNRVKARGVMYKIYLYERNKMSFFRLLAEKFRFWVASRSNVIETVFVLNDEDSANEFNQLYKTDKFQFIPDPVPEIDISKCVDIREELHIPQGHKVFLHFGSMDGRKGTLEILRAIDLCNINELSNTSFVFAGKVGTSIKEEFYNLLDNVKGKANILVFDEFCSYEFLNNLCYSCDMILMPYKLTSLSSGVIGYASFFGKTVIGPSEGLIGNIIRKNSLGYCLPDVSVNSIRKAFAYEKVSPSNEYYINNSIENFIGIIQR